MMTDTALSLVVASMLTATLIALPFLWALGLL